MLDQFEVAQARAAALGAQAEIYQAIHTPHGSYRFLVDLGSVVCFAHSPVGRVLYDLDEDHDTVNDSVSA